MVINISTKHGPQLDLRFSLWQVVAEIQTQSQSQIVFKALQTCINASDYSSLDSAQQRILKSSLQSMEHSGVGLPASERQEFNDIQQELATLSTTVNNNVLDSTKKFRLTFTNKDELKGLPETALNLASNMYESDSVDNAPGKYSKRRCEQCSCNSR